MFQYLFESAITVAHMPFNYLLNIVDPPVVVLVYTASPRYDLTQSCWLLHRTTSGHDPDRRRFFQEDNGI
jgi:hypothetical protein